MIQYTWSYSSLDLFKQCPHKYYRLRVAKDIVEPESEAMRYGKDVHKAAEDFIKDGTPVPEKFAFMRELLEPVRKITGQHLCEYRLGLTRALEPCEFFGKDVWWRGIPDFLAIDGEKATLLDYKTGKSSKYADTKQLDLVASALFTHFPQLQTIKSALMFVISKDFIKKEHTSAFRTAYIEHFNFDIMRIETATKTGVWNAVSGPLCGYCPVKTCPNFKERRK